MNIKPIRSDSDYDAALEEIERLFASEPGTEDADRLKVLVVIAQDYQRTHHPVGPPDMQSAIEFELDRRDLAHQGAGIPMGKVAVDDPGKIGAASMIEVSVPGRRATSRQDVSMREEGFVGEAPDFVR